MRQFLTVLAVVVLGLQAVPHTQATRLQIHFMDVGQGDGAILIASSPKNGLGRAGQSSSDRQRGFAP